MVNVVVWDYNLPSATSSSYIYNFYYEILEKLKDMLGGLHFNMN